jgi:hypothetical protein
MQLAYLLGEVLDAPVTLRVGPGREQDLVSRKP